MNSPGMRRVDVRNAPQLTSHASSGPKLSNPNLLNASTDRDSQVAISDGCELATRCIEELLTVTVPGPQAVAEVGIENTHPSGELIEEHLQRSAYASVRAIHARFERNVVVLQGRVPSFYLRQIALSIVMKHLPGIFIVDFIEVSYL